MSDVLTWLSQRFADHCDGDWEHSDGVRIETLDNPGWQVSIDIRDTELSDRPDREVEMNRSETDWLHIFVREGKFEAYCGPLNLIEALSYFRTWAETPEARPD
jgi:hypothetical protein